MNLKQYPEAIETATLELSAIARRLDTLREDRQQIEDQFTRQILRAYDAQGKALFSNESSRAIEIRARQIGSEGWCNLRDSIVALEEARACVIARAERLRGEFSIAKIEARAAVVAAEIAQ